MVRVYLFRGKHPMYESLLTHPPAGVEYLPRKRETGVEEYSLYGPSQSILRKVIDGSFETIGIPRWVPILRSYDLVHSCRGFFVLGRNPFVVDVEHVSSFVGMNHDRLSSPRTRRMVRKGLSSPRCARILPHSEASKRTLSLVTSERELLDKTTVLYPSMDVSLCTAPQVKNAVPRLLFMGEYYWKGGREVLDACARLSQKHDFVLKFISVRVHPPQADLDKAMKSINLEYVRGPIPRKELFEKVYPSSDVFLMPTFFDTFGYAFLEAMAFGLPCIGADHFAVPEIVQDGVSGLLVKPPTSCFDSTGLGHPTMGVERVDGSKMTDELVPAIEQMLSSENLRERMGAAGRREVTDGKFSIASRNEILREVYESSSAH